MGIKDILLSPVRDATGPANLGQQQPAAASDYPKVIFIRIVMSPLRFLLFCLICIFMMEIRPDCSIFRSAISIDSSSCPVAKLLDGLSTIEGNISFFF